MDNQISNMKDHEKPRNPRRQSGMDRVVEKTTWQKIKKPVTWGGTVFVAIVLFFAFGPEEGRALKVQNDRITISTVVSGEFDDFIPVRGQVAPLRTLYLDAIEGGRVESIYVEDGADIEAGQLIVELSNTSLQLDVISREAQVTEQLNNLRNTELSLEQNRLAHKRNLVEINYNLVRLEREINRLEPLLEKNLVSDDTYEQLKDEFDYFTARHAVTIESQETDQRLQEIQMEQLRVAGNQLERNLGVARKNLDSLNMRSAVAGKLTAFDLEIGQALNRGDRIGQIDDPSQFKVTANIDEYYLGRVDIGQTATVEVDRRDYSMAIRKIYPQVQNGTFRVDLNFDGEQASSIRRGQTLQLNLQLGSPSESVLIPNGAFYQDTGGNWVFVVAPNGERAIRRNVRLGRRNVRFIEVLDGLEPGEEVVTSPYTNYIDMDRLELQAAN
jgi:HlyD family secretion protein